MLRYLLALLNSRLRYIYRRAGRVLSRPCEPAQWPAGTRPTRAHCYSCLGARDIRRHHTSHLQLGHRGTWAPGIHSILLLQELSWKHDPVYYSDSSTRPQNDIGSFVARPEDGAESIVYGVHMYRCPCHLGLLRNQGQPLVSCPLCPLIACLAPAPSLPARQSRTESCVTLMLYAWYDTVLPRHRCAKFTGIVAGGYAFLSPLTVLYIMNNVHFSLASQQCEYNKKQPFRKQPLLPKGLSSHTSSQ